MTNITPQLPAKRVIVALVSVRRREAITTDGQVWPITQFLDWEGDECQAPEATAFVAGSAQTGWIWGCIKDFQPVTKH